MASLPVFKELNTGIDAKETDNCACACEKERAHLQRNECKKKKRRMSISERRKWSFLKKQKYASNGIEMRKIISSRILRIYSCIEVKN